MQLAFECLEFADEFGGGFRVAGVHFYVILSMLSVACTLLMVLGRSNCRGGSALVVWRLADTKLQVTDFRPRLFLLPRLLPSFVVYPYVVLRVVVAPGAASNHRFVVFDWVAEFWLVDRFRVHVLVSPSPGGAVACLRLISAASLPQTPGGVSPSLRKVRRECLSSTVL